MKWSKGHTVRFWAPNTHNLAQVSFFFNPGCLVTHIKKIFCVGWRGRGLLVVVLEHFVATGEFFWKNAPDLESFQNTSKILHQNVVSVF